jgi:bacteriorhodopsin
MTDLPPPDVKDSAGRLRRLVLALLIGAAAGALAYAITSSMVKPVTVDGVYTSTHVGNTYKFVFYMTGLAFAVAFSITLAIANYRAKQQWRRELVAHAKVVS